jgi:hypothetical protein
VPPGASIVAEVTYGVEPTYLVLTRNNTADLMDLQSLSGVDPTRMLVRTIFVATRGSSGLISEHSLLAEGRFDSRHIVKAAVKNGATETEYLGIPVLIVPPLERDKGISRDVRWLAFIDSQIAVFGTIPMVQQELGRYLERSPVDLPLMRLLSRLRLSDQSWSVLTPTIHNREIVRRTLGGLDPDLGHALHANDGLILGIHFGRRVEIEYESVPDSGNSEQGPSHGESGFSTEGPQRASRLFSNNNIILRKVISLSRNQYHEFITKEEMRELTHVEPESGQTTRN